jgi:opacity protein-like surface antigen
MKGEGKMKAIAKKVLIFFVVFLAGMAASADASDYRNYATAGAGLNMPTGGLDDAGYDAGFATWITCGRMLNPNLAVEGTFGYFYTDQDLSGTTSEAGYYDRDDEVNVTALMFTLKGLLPVGPATLFAGGGVGGYHVALHAEIDTTRLGDFDADEDDTVWGLHVLLGGNWDLTPRIFLGGQWLYRWTDDVNIDKHMATVPVRLKGDLDGCTVTFFGGFRF